MSQHTIDHLGKNNRPCFDMRATGGSSKLPVKAKNKGQRSDSLITFSSSVWAQWAHWVVAVDTHKVFVLKPVSACFSLYYRLWVVVEYISLNTTAISVMHQLSWLCCVMETHFTEQKFSLTPNYQTCWVGRWHTNRLRKKESFIF